MVQSIDTLIEQAICALHKQNQKPESVRSAYLRSFKPISVFFASKTAVHYSDILMNELEQVYEGQKQKGEISRFTFNCRVRGLRIIREIAETGMLEWRRYDIGKEMVLSAGFSEIALDFKKHLTTTLSNPHACYHIVVKFFHYLQEQGVLCPEKITTEHVQQFMVRVSAGRPRSMGEVATALRKLDAFFLGKGLIASSFTFSIEKVKEPYRKIQSGMSADDLELLLTSIDRTTPIGKRDHAIFLLAASTGFRASDVVELKLNDIDWRNNEIHIVQKKTGKPLKLSLHKAAGAAIAEYILNGRPISNSQNVFLRHKAPHVAFRDGAAIKDIMQERMAAAGIDHSVGDGKTFHGIRRMLGKNMAENAVPVTTIAQVLGHATCNTSTKQYIAVDIIHLRECALGVDSLKGGQHADS